MAHEYKAYSVVVPSSMEQIAEEGIALIPTEALLNKNKRTKIAAKIRECGDCIEKIVRIIQENLTGSRG